MTEEKKRVSIKSLTEEINGLKEKVKKVDILEKQMKEIKGVMELLLNDRKEEIVKNSDSSHNFNCSVCTMGFVIKSDLQKHIKEEHQQKVHCDICQVNFMRTAGLKLTWKNMPNKRCMNVISVENFFI